MRNLRLKEFNYFHQDLTDGKWQTQNFSLRLRALSFELRFINEWSQKHVILFGHWLIQQTFTGCLLYAGRYSKQTLGRWGQIGYLS